jgi:hypothetical protein
MSVQVLAAQVESFNAGNSGFGSTKRGQDSSLDNNGKRRCSSSDGVGYGAGRGSGVQQQAQQAQQQEAQRLHYPQSHQQRQMQQPPGQQIHLRLTDWLANFQTCQPSQQYVQGITLRVKQIMQERGYPPPEKRKVSLPGVNFGRPVQEVDWKREHEAFFLEAVRKGPLQN